MSKKLLFIIESLGGGGTQSVVSTIISEWKKLDLELDLLTFKPRKFDEFPVDKKIKRAIIEKNNKSNSIINRFFNNIIFIFRLRKFLKSYEHDFILSFITATNLLVLIASIGLKKKIIISERNDIHYQYITIFHRILRFFIYKYAFLVTSNIHKSLKVMESYVSRRKLVFLPNPVRFSKNSYKKNKNKNKIILSIGRLNKQKGYDILLDAFSNFNKKPQFNNWKLYILGEGPEREYLEKMIEKLNLCRSVFLLGYNEPTKYYKIASIYVQSSIFEGMPNSVLEAMMFGVPTILNTKIRGIKYLAKDNFSCLYFNNDKDDLYKKLLSLAKRTEKRNTIIENAFREVKKYNKKRIAKVWLEKLNIFS